jgi:type IV secretory pathway TraG/TraD family ATPase VirD4
VLVRLGGLSWTREEFVQGFLITGGVGTGKTRAGLLALLHQVFQNDPHWGGLCLDEKANFHELLLGAARAHGREKDVILLGGAPRGQPVHRLNLVGDRLLSHETYSRLIVEVAVSLGQNREQTFFVKQAQTHIARAFDALAALEYEVTLDNAYRLLLDENELKSVLAELARRNAPQAASLAQHFQSQFLLQAPEQLSGVRGSIANFLDPYLPGPVAEVFCRDTTSPLSAINQGKIFCLTLPPQFAIERRYIATLLKLRFYQEAMLRYARPATERARDNLLLLWADEAQQFVATSDTLGDHNAVDRLREAGVAVVLATQSLNSFVPPLGKDKAEVLRLNLRNRLFFQAATEADAQDAADFLGKRLRRKVTWNVGRGGRSRSYVREEVHRVLPHVFRLLKNHECVVVRADKRFRRRMLPPLEADGRVSPWFPWWRKWLR